MPALANQTLLQNFTDSITEAEIDVSLKRLYTARFRLGLFDPESKVPYASLPCSEVDSAAHRALALEAANKSMVLLKNDGVLPLRSTLRTIAVIGPNAASLSAIEGNYNAIPSEPVLPVDGIQSGFKGARVLYAQGSPYVEGMPLPVPRTMLHIAANATEEGLKAEYFASGSFDKKPVLTRVDKQVDFDWSSASPVPGAPHLYCSGAAKFGESTDKSYFSVQLPIPKLSSLGGPRRTSTAYRSCS